MTASALLLLGFVFLAGHLLLDVRQLGTTLRHPRDFAWTAATLLFFVGHLLFSGELLAFVQMWWP